MNSLIIVGGSTLGMTVAEIARRTGRYVIRGFIDDSSDALHSSVAKNFLGRTSDVESFKANCNSFVIAIGSNSDRRRIHCLFQSLNMEDRLVAVVDPSASILGEVKVNAGAIVFPGATIGPSASIGACAIISANSFIGAQVSLKQYVNICPGVSIGSSATLEEGAYIGMGANVLQGKTVGAWSVVGAGSVVTRDLPASGVFAGIPAKSR